MRNTSNMGRLTLRKSFNVRLFLSVSLIAFSQFNFGFDQQGYSSTQAMKPFAKQFGTLDPTTQEYALETKWVSYFNSFIFIGQAFGVVLGSHISRRFGRRMCMFVMSIWAIVCAILAITSKSASQILTARILNYIYIGMELSVVPIFQAEIVPPNIRGFIVGTYQSTLYLGGLIINLVCLGTGKLSGSQAYRIPYGLFFVVPTVITSLIWFIPESPRWLLLRDRQEEALQSLRQLREGKFSDEEIEREFAEILVSIQEVPTQGTLFDIFRGSNRRRTLIVCGANFFLQSTGQIFASLYGALFVSTLNTVSPFVVTVILALTNFLTSILANFLTDIIGRRNPIFIGASLQIAAQMTMGGLGTATPLTKIMAAGIVSTMVVQAFGYSLGWAPACHILSAEIPSNRSRDMTYRVASILNIITQFAISFSLPYLLNAPYANLHSKVGFIFASIACVSLVFAWFCVPDVSGRSLEEIDVLFESKAPIRNFRYVEVDLSPSQKVTEKS